MKAATPHGELPSDGIWWVRRRRSHGDKAKRPSGFSIDDNQRTMSTSMIGMTKSIQPICCSAVSTVSSKDKYHDTPRKIKVTAIIRRTGYGKGLRENTSKIESVVLLLPFAIFFFFFFWSPLALGTDSKGPFRI